MMMISMEERLHQQGGVAGGQEQEVQGGELPQQGLRVQQRQVQQGHVDQVSSELQQRQVPG